MKIGGTRVIALCLAATIIAGCCGGGTTKVEVPKSTVTTTTAGQQLMDLQKAYESGAIDEKQYKKMKQDIIDQSSEK